MYTVVWKIFVWNHFIVENDQENNFCGLLNTHENILTTK